MIEKPKTINKDHDIRYWVDEEVLRPTWKTVSNPTITRRFHIVDRALMKAKMDIQKEEDQKIFAAINALVK